jgi:hypothetical protein
MQLVCQLPNPAIFNRFGVVHALHGLFSIKKDTFCIRDDTKRFNGIEGSEFFSELDIVEGTYVDAPLRLFNLHAEALP